LSRTETGLLRIGLLLALILLLGERAGFFDIQGLHLPWKCPFLALTGHPCPGCGMTDAVKFLLQGKIKLAFRANPQVFPLSLFILRLAISPSGFLCWCQEKKVFEIWLASVLLWWLLRLFLSW